MENTKNAEVLSDDLFALVAFVASGKKAIDLKLYEAALGKAREHLAMAKGYTDIIRHMTGINLTTPTESILQDLDNIEQFLK